MFCQMLAELEAKVFKICFSMPCKRYSLYHGLCNGRAGEIGREISCSTQVGTFSFSLSFPILEIQFLKEFSCLRWLILRQTFCICILVFFFPPELPRILDLKDCHVYIKEPMRMIALLKELRRSEPSHLCADLVCSQSIASLLI